MNLSGVDGAIFAYGDIGATTTETVVLQQLDLGLGVVTGIPIEGTLIDNVSPVVQDDLVLANVQPPGGGSGLLYRDYPFASAGAFAQFPYPTPPAPIVLYPWNVAPQSSHTRAAHLYYDLTTLHPYIVRGNFETGTDFSAAIDVSGAIAPDADPSYANTLAYDPALDRAYLLTTPGSYDCFGKTPTLVTVDFQNATVSQKPLPGVTAGFTAYPGYMLATDPSSHVAVVATECQRHPDDTVLSELATVDLQTGGVRQVFRHTFDDIAIGAHGFPGVLGDAYAIEVDPSRHLVLQRSLVCATPLRLFDEHARPCLNEYDDTTGQRVASLSGVFADGPFAGFPLAANLRDRRGIEPGGEDFSFYLQYLAVQPYEY
jgi:hypothetical protein